MTKVARAVEGFKFGCDPELFVTDSEGKLVSAHGLIPGTKKDPYIIEYGAVQVDGMAAEFNIDPAESFEEFDRNIKEVMKQLKAMLPKGYGLLATSSVNFPQEVIDAQPPEALELGCDPDFNAWANGKANPRPVPTDPTLRTASGHVHIGWGNGIDIAHPDHLTHCMDFVKQLDWFLGAPALKYDPDVKRRQLYGEAGAFRPKPYGVEYRVLSNFWVSSVVHRRWVWNRLQEAIEAMTAYYLPKDAKYENASVREAINAGVWDNPYTARDYRYPLQSINRTLSYGRMAA